MGVGVGVGAGEGLGLGDGVGVGEVGLAVGDALLELVGAGCGVLAHPTRCLDHKSTLSVITR